MLAALDKYSAQYYPELSLISAADRKGYTPLHWACYYGKCNTYTTIISVCMWTVEKSTRRGNKPFYDLSMMNHQDEFMKTQ